MVSLLLSGPLCHHFLELLLANLLGARGWPPGDALEVSSWVQSRGRGGSRVGGEAGSIQHVLMLLLPRSSLFSLLFHLFLYLRDFLDFVFQLFLRTLYCAIALSKFKSCFIFRFICRSHLFLFSRCHSFLISLRLTLKLFPFLLLPAMSLSSPGSFLLLILVSVFSCR